jgi:hypothetical protein
VAANRRYKRGAHMTRQGEPLLDAARTGHGRQGTGMARKAPPIDDARARKRSLLHALDGAFGIARLWAVAPRTVLDRW